MLSRTNIFMFINDISTCNSELLILVHKIYNLIFTCKLGFNDV